jgi:rhodanese-related sulfurtransferase
MTTTSAPERLAPTGRPRRRRAGVALVGLSALLGLTACGGDDSGQSATATVTVAATSGSGGNEASTASTIEIKESTIVIDVRTPEEFAAGHLDYAINLDVSNPNFAEEIDAYGRDGDYVLYCRSGARAAQAAAAMANMGFTNVTNAGGLEEASALTKLAIVTD